MGFPLAIEDAPNRTERQQHLGRAPASVLDPDIAPPSAGPHEPRPRPRASDVPAHAWAPERVDDRGAHDDGLEEHAERLREEEQRSTPIPERPRADGKLWRVDAVHQAEVHQAGESEHTHALGERASAPMRDELVREVYYCCGHDEGDAPEGRVPAGRPEVGEADCCERVAELGWPACRVRPQGNEDDGDERVRFVYGQGGPNADGDGVYDLLVPWKGRDGVVVIDVPCSSSIDDVTEVYDENKPKEMKDSFANEGGTALSVLRCEKRSRTPVPVSVLEPRGSTHGEKEVG